MLHILFHVVAGMAFGSVLAASLGLIALQLHGQRRLITAALFGEQRTLAPKWTSRIRTVSRPVPVVTRPIPRSYATA